MRHLVQKCSAPCIVLILAALFIPPSARADERILSYHSDIHIQPDGNLIVEENIAVRAEGGQIKRGIYRDFPTRYKSKDGYRYSVAMNVVDVLRDGEPETYRIENQSNGKRIYIGRKDVFLEPGEYRYTIRFTTTRQIGFFKDHDELYWNVTGNGWAFPIDRASADVHLPARITGRVIEKGGYTGPQGSRDQNLTSVQTYESVVHFEITQPLAQSEGLTIFVTWPKGLIPEPSRSERTLYLLKDNPGIVETYFTSKDLFEICPKPRAITYNEKDLHGQVLKDFNCFVFFNGDVERMKSRRTDFDYLKYGAAQFFVPKNSTLIVLSGSIKDSASTPISVSAPMGCESCVTDESSKLTTCAMKDMPKAVCNVVQYKDIRAMAIWGNTSSLSACNWYVEGSGDISVNADACSIKTMGSGKINADCRSRFAIEALEGDHSVFIGSGDGFVIGDSGDTIYAGSGVNLFFIDNSTGPAKVVKTSDDMPCMRIIKNVP